MIFYEAKIIDIVQEFDTVKTYYLELPEGFTWEEGACMHIGLEGFKPETPGGKPNKDLVHHYSIVNMPYENKLAFTTRFTENPSLFKSQLLDMKIGDSVTVFKIHSNMKLRRENKPLVLISMGIGNVTFRSICLEYSKNQENLPKITNLNVSANGEYLFKEDFESYPIENIWTSNREDFYEKLKEVAKDKDQLFYIIGSDGFIIDVVENLLWSGVDLRNITLDKREEKFIELTGKISL